MPGIEYPDCGVKMSTDYAGRMRFTSICRHVVDPRADESDRCIYCDELVCPDTGKTVVYMDDPRLKKVPEDAGEYWHLDGSTCFLHQVSVPNSIT